MPWPSFFEGCVLAAVGWNSSLVAYPSQSNFSSIVAPYNLDCPVTPAAVAFPKTASQVAALVGCAVMSGYKVQPKSGGHSAANYGSATGELSINLANLKQFSMDKSTFRASVGAGMRLLEVDEQMYNAGQRFVPHGASGDVGIGGHATVGGAGYGWRQYGLTIDHLQELEVVVANGTIVRASATENPDLFFAMRGAGASYGIVTKFIFNTLPAPAQTVSFVYLWNTADVKTRADIYKAAQALSYDDSVPSELQTMFGITNSTIFMSGAYFGSLGDFNALSLGSRFPSAVHPPPTIYTNFFEASKSWADQLAHNGGNQPAFIYMKSIAGQEDTRIPDDVVDKVFEYLATADNGGANWDIELQTGIGSKESIPSTATAFPHRQCAYVILSTVRTNGRVSETTTAFLDGLHALMKSGNPDAYYGEYAGFIDSKADPGQARYHYWGANLERLEGIKTAYDPLDVFHNEQGVLPQQY